MQIVPDLTDVTLSTGRVITQVTRTRSLPGYLFVWSYSTNGDGDQCTRHDMDLEFWAHGIHGTVTYDSASHCGFDRGKLPTYIPHRNWPLVAGCIYSNPNFWIRGKRGHEARSRWSLTDEVPTISASVPCARPIAVGHNNGWHSNAYGDYSDYDGFFFFLSMLGSELKAWVTEDMIKRAEDERKFKEWEAREKTPERAEERKAERAVAAAKRRKRSKQ